MKPYYTGLLGRKRTASEFVSAIRELGGDEVTGHWERLFEPNRRDVRLLFEHHGVDPREANAWRKLALALARAHVPYFKIAGARGRRRKVPGIAEFFAQGDPSGRKRTRGRPAKWDTQRLRRLLAMREVGARLLHNQRRKVTDRLALTEALTESRVREGAPRALARQEAEALAKKFAKRLPDARRAVR